MNRLVAVLLLAACTAAHARNEGIWELGHKQFLDYEATPGSRLVKRLLAEPIEYDLQRAEVARVALYIMRRTEEATLLNDYMDHDVVAGLLAMPHTKAATVGEAIAQQRARPTPVDMVTVNRAAQAALQRGARSNDRGRVFFDERHVMFDPDGIGHGYPANRKDSSRTQAHELLFASTCADRGTCLGITAFFQKPDVRAALARMLHFVAVLLGGAVLVWAIIRGVAALPLGQGNALGRFWPLGFLLAPPVPVIVWFVAAITGMLEYTRNWGLGILVIPMYGIPISYAVAALLLTPIVVVLRRYGRLSFAGIVLSATLIELVVPPIWKYLFYGSFLVRYWAFSGSVEMVLYALILSVLFALLSWPKVRAEAHAPPSRILSRFAWFVSLAGVHGLLVAFGYHEHMPEHVGIVSTSLAPWLLLSWLDPVGLYVRLGWCSAVWLVLYWLLAGVMARLAARGASIELRASAS